MPLYLFCSRDLLVARLRPANVDPAAGALDELQRVIAAIQAQWSQVKFGCGKIVPKTGLANSRISTIRTHLLKRGTLIRVSARRIHVTFHSAFSRRPLFHLAYQQF